jgi:hypothetical protein
VRQRDPDDEAHAFGTPSHQRSVCRECDEEVVGITRHCLDTPTSGQPTVDNGSFKQAV